MKTKDWEDAISVCPKCEKVKLPQKIILVTD